MKSYDGADVRNVVLAGHGHSGKTSLAAALLYTSGATNRLTRVDEGNTITDYDDEEVARKLTISTAVATVEWNKKKVNVIDTPGFNMFINDTKASMVAADGALVLVDSVAGVEVQTGTLGLSLTQKLAKAISTFTVSPTSFILSVNTIQLLASPIAAAWSRLLPTNMVFPGPS